MGSGLTVSRAYSSRDTTQGSEGPLGPEWSMSMSSSILCLIHPRSRASLLALITIYSRLLERIERSNYDVFRRRVRLPLWEKSWIVWRALSG